MIIVHLNGVYLSIKVLLNSFASIGPCALTSIHVVTQCNSDTILVEWELSENTPLYVVTAEGHDQSLISCNSSSTSCELHNIRCGMHYSIIVSTSSDKCSSMRSPPKKIKTGICAASHAIHFFYPKTVIKKIVYLTSIPHRTCIYICKTRISQFRASK